MRFFILLFLLCSSCSHSIRIKGAHFANPIASEKPLSGDFAISLATETTVTIINDISSDPPQREQILINEDTHDLLGMDTGLNASLGLYKSMDLYLDNSLIGFKWQFLNHGLSKGQWVAALQAGLAKGSQSTSFSSSSGASEAKSDLERSQVGFSFGYTMDSIVPYFSYLYEDYDVETKVENSSGNYGPYQDRGNHQYLAVGIHSHTSTIVYALEYNHIIVSWDRSSTENEGALGAKLGFSW